MEVFIIIINIFRKKHFIIASIIIFIIASCGYLLYSTTIPFYKITNTTTIKTSSNQNINYNLVSNSKGVPVLYYHSVRASAENEVTITPELLKSELQYLKDCNYTTLTISEINDYILNNSPIPKKSILITFDDGYMDNYDNAFPILKELGLKATIFCITSKLDGSYYLSQEAIKDMSDYGIDIQSHTISHNKLGTMNYNSQYNELKKSKETLETITGKPVISIAYPYGSFNDDSIKATKDVGYSLGFTTNKGLCNRSTTPLKLNRIYISSNYNLETFKQILSEYN